MRAETAVRGWAEDQQRTVSEDGVRPARVLLLGPDGDTWEAWAADTEDLPERIWTTLSRTAATLPQGEATSVRLVARNSDGETVSQMGHTLRGTSVDGREAASAHLTMQRSLQAALTNGAELQRQQREEIERLHARLNMADQQLSVATEGYVSMKLRLAELEARARVAEIEEAAAGIRGAALLEVWSELRPHVPDLISSATKMLAGVTNKGTT